MSENCNALFCDNNYFDNGSITASSALSDYPATNLFSTIRSRLWKPSGIFEISASNNKVYINGTTYTIPVLTYTVSTLITAFNLATGKTLSRNSLGRFVITLGASGTLNLATTTNAIWDALGYLGSSNLTGTVFTADERRYSTGEWLKIDMGIAQRADFAALIMPANEKFSAPNAVIKLQGDNLDIWNSPAVNLTMAISADGSFIAPPDTTQLCRFWRILITDRTNNALSFAVAHIGSAKVLSNTNIATGFSRNREDQSIQMYSEAGQLYVDRRPKVTRLSSVQIQMLKESELIEIEQLFYDLGNNVPFFLCLDPKLVVSTSLSQMTHYVAVTGGFSLSHVIASYYNFSVELREYL
jgi:hypothetical protein